MPERKKVLLIGWDAAEWKMIHPLMDAGRMPNLQALIERGTMGRLATLHPPLSPMLWTSIATGKRPFKHGIHGFSEPAVGGLGIQPITNLSRKCKAVWNIFNQNDIRSTVIGWWPSHPAEPIDGVTVSDHYHTARGPIKDKEGDLDEIWPLLPGTVHPPRLAKQLADLRFHPDEVVREMVEPFIPQLAEIDQKKDRRPSVLVKTLCECVSIHSAATWLMENEPWDFFGVYYDAIDHFCHGFMKYHAPRQPWVGEKEFELYQNVVAQAYCLHDQMLGKLLEIGRKVAGEDLTVLLISDHGFHPDHLRPREIPDIPAGPAIEHSDLGIFVASGPGIKKDELIHGASVIDITPTLLALYGLPVGDDMDGKVLAGAFEEPPQMASIPSWEDVAGEDGRHPPDLAMDPLAARESMEQMIALGYIERPSENIETAIEETVRELQYNLAEAYQDDNRHFEAAEILGGLCAKDPDEQRYAVRYFASCQAMGQREEMRRIVEDLDGRRRQLFEEARVKVREWNSVLKERRRERRAQSDELLKKAPLLTEEEKAEAAKWSNLCRFGPAVVEFLKGQLFTAERKYARALECFEAVTAAHMARPGLLIQTGDLYRKLRRFRDARRTYQKALRIDPDNPHAELGLCRLDLRSGRFERAAEHALNCIQQRYSYPMAHFLLGVALVKMNEVERGVEAMRVAVNLNPHFPAAHRRLAALVGGDEAEEHRRVLGEMRRSKTNFRLRERLAARASNGGKPESIPASSLEGARPLDESAIIVTGLPRSGTSMVMQMLAAGGVPVVADEVRAADEDNPRGYLEFEPVKRLLADATWFGETKGKAIKVVAPLLPAIPRDIPCRVILIERNLDEILDSQTKMVARNGGRTKETVERRELLSAEFSRTIARTRGWMSRRPATSWLILDRDEVLMAPDLASRRIAEFLDGSANSGVMAQAVDTALHRNRRVMNSF